MLGISATVIGVLSLVASLGIILDVKVVLMVGSGGRALLPLWSIWMGVDLVRDRAPVIAEGRA
ncbi:MAG: hypothetical protein HYY34_01080 [Chloroflexi bacterium]|nr:hypothetical protein [Chloroflexota bacterium]